MRRIHDSPARLLAAGALLLCVFDGRVMAQTAPKLPIEIVPMVGHSKSVAGLWTGLDGRVLLSVDTSKVAKLWDTATGALLRTWTGADTGSRDGVALAPDGRSMVAFSGQYGHINMYRWDVATGMLVSTVPTDFYNPSGAAFSPDGQLLSASGKDLRLIDANSGRMRFLLDKSWAYSVAFSPDGRRLASGSENGMKLWDTANGQLVGMFAAPKGYSRYAPVVFSPNGRLGASIGMEGNQQRILLWNAATAAPVLTLDVRSADGFYALAFAPDSKTIAVIGKEDAITIWDTTSGHLIRNIPRRCTGTQGQTPLVFLRNGILASAAGCENSIRLWNTSTGELIRTFEGLSPIEGSGISPDDRTIAATHPLGGINLLDAASGRLVRVLAQDNNERRSDNTRSSGMSFSNDGTKLATHDGKSIKIWETASWRLLRDLAPQPAQIDSMKFSPDGRSFASGYTDYDADKQKAKSWYRLWDVNTGRVVRNSSAVQMDASGSGQLAYAPDGKSLAFASPTGFDLFDAASGRRLRSSRVPKEFDVTEEPDSLLFFPDGRTVVSTNQYLVLLWDVASAKLLRKIEAGGGASDLRAVAVSPDARVLATGDFDTIKLWDPATGQLLRTLAGNGYVASLSFSKDGRQLIAGCGDDGNFDLPLLM